MSWPRPRTVWQPAIKADRVTSNNMHFFNIGSQDSSQDLAHVGETAGDGRRRRHRGTHQMVASSRALPALEIAVGGGSATLSGLQAVGVHRQAHGAARLTPLEAGGAEDLVQPFRLGLALH